MDPHVEVDVSMGIPPARMQNGAFDVVGSHFSTASRRSLFGWWDYT
jgi:hypothetical protein